MAISILAGTLGAVTSGAEKIKGSIEGGIERASALSLNRIDSVRLIKYGIILSIILGILIIAVSGLRGVLTSIDLVGCGLGNTGCDWPLVGGGCTNCAPTSMTSYNWAWSEEWVIRCLFFLSVSTTIFIVIYNYFKILFDWLLHIDKKFDDMDDWIFGVKRWLGDRD